MDEDVEFQVAIAASLAEAQPKQERQRNLEVVDPTVDSPTSEDEEARFERELALALEASKKRSFVVAPTRSSPTASLAAHATASSASAVATPPLSEPLSSVISTPGQIMEAGPSSSVSSFMSERAMLERERLARQKRHLEERSIKTNTKRQRTESPTPDPSSAPSSPDFKHNALPRQAGKTTLDPSNGYFWDGEIRQTTNTHVKVDPNRPRFKITDIVSPASDLEFVLLSSYCTDTPWLTTFLPREIPVLLVVDPDPSQRHDASLKNLGIGDWLRVTPRIWQSRGVMHIKVLLLFYKSGRLRVAIPTANLVDYDWRDIENTVFVQDLPPITDSSADPQSHDFPTYLWGVLKSLNVPAGLLNLVNSGYPSLPLQSLQNLQDKWDWCKMRARLVASVAGNYEGWYNVRMYGHPRLSAIIRDSRAQPKKGKVLNIECQGSSVGNCTTQYLNEVYKSCCGIDPISWIDIPMSRQVRQPWPPVKILFPTLKTVDDSVFGRNGGGSFFCKKPYWSKLGSPKELFYSVKAKDGQVLMHTKMIVGTYKTGSLPVLRPAPLALPASGKGKAKEKPEVIVLSSDSETEASTTEDEEDAGEQKTPEAWVYMGSHNFTMAAWGTVSGSILVPKLNISNFEMGIVLPIEDQKELERIVPWERPPRRYGPKDVPWMQEEHRNSDEPTWRQLAATD
ncbi:phospholipase D/nuclease [Dacryopinax primogenitus]|uniref:Phospholipase D/nuclease n=1 Tax=Dacryopinax primogenitus (strain DJM 731) TaxID=1858805 RepID=M5G5S2_DACPD|nr:phospholipase D/nuclease [Dacryopinax primogenitus]EJT99107.1 phospholipase D/nuclease [Dacryopinax primogenitus]